MHLDIYDKYINTDLVRSVDRNFNIEIKDNEVYDQKGSLLCWVYAGINMLKNELKCVLENEVNFSVNYISFFDRYEKLDRLYDKIIEEDFKCSQIKYILFDYINTCGDFSAFKYLIQKYGIVLESQMQITENTFIPNDINELLKEKVINDIDIILNIKKDNSNFAELYSLKEKMMSENYVILSNIYGKPPTDIKIKGETITPIEFSRLYINELLENYIEIISLSTKPYNKGYQLEFNVPNFKKTEYLNLEINEIKESIIKSLKEGHLVWFGCSYRYMSSSYKNKNGILFNNLYDFKKIGIEKLKKSIAEKYDFLNYDHAMLFTGVNIENNEIKSWKVLNSFGIQNNDNGYFIMDDNFFDQNVFLFAINKKYLSLYSKNIYK